MTDFSMLWDTEVKQLAQKCIKEQEFVRLSSEGQDYIHTEADIQYLESIKGKYVDLLAMSYISYMIWQVEFSLANDRECMAQIATNQIYATLVSEDYFKNVFKCDDSSDEWKDLAALRDGLKKLMRTCN